MRGYVILISAIVLMAVMSPVCATITEILYSDSVAKKVGMRDEAGDHIDTHTSDDTRHHFNITTRRGYLDYNFTTSLLNAEIMAIQYNTELLSTSPLCSDPIDIQIYDWSSLTWATLEAGIAEPLLESERTYNLLVSPWDYINRATGEIKVRYYLGSGASSYCSGVYIDYQNITIWANESKPSNSPWVYYEEVYANSTLKKVGLEDEVGDYLETSISDDSCHYFNISSRRGYLEYEFTALNINYELVKLQYQTELWTGTASSSEIDIQVYNWDTLAWETLWSDISHGGYAGVYTWNTLSTDYLCDEGHLKIRYLYNYDGSPPFSGEVYLDYQNFIFFFDLTQSGDYPVGLLPCAECFNSSSAEPMVGVVETLDHTETHVSDDTVHAVNINSDDGYLIYNFETGIETNKSNVEGDRIKSSSRSMSGAFNEFGTTHTDTHNSDDIYHQFEIDVDGGYLEYVFHTGCNPSDVVKLQYQTEFRNDLFCDDGVDIRVYNWTASAWETLWDDRNHTYDIVYTWDATTPSDFVNASGDMRISYYVDHGPMGPTSCKTSVDYQYVQAWTNTSSMINNPGIEKMQYVTELSVASGKCIDIDIWNWGALMWENLRNDLNTGLGVDVYTHTWEAGPGGAVEDYLRDNGTVRIRYLYDNCSGVCSSTAYIDFQELSMWWPCMSLTKNLTKPSFFDRLDGSLNLSSKYVTQTMEYFGGKGDIGLESLVSLYEFNATGINTSSSFSWIDHLYWSNQSGCKVYGAYPWLRIDNETATGYCLDDLLYDCL